MMEIEAFHQSVGVGFYGSLSLPQMQRSKQAVSWVAWSLANVVSLFV